MIQSIQHHLWNMVERYDDTLLVFTELLVFSDDVTEDRCSWKNSEVYRLYTLYLVISEFQI